MLIVTAETCNWTLYKLYLSPVPSRGPSPDVHSISIPSCNLQVDKLIRIIWAVPKIISAKICHGAGHDGSCLRSQHSGGQDTRINISSRPAFPINTCLLKTKNHLLWNDISFLHSQVSFRGSPACQRGRKSRAAQEPRIPMQQHMVAFPWGRTDIWNECWPQARVLEWCSEVRKCHNWDCATGGSQWHIPAIQHLTAEERELWVRDQPELQSKY